LHSIRRGLLVVGVGGIIRKCGANHVRKDTGLRKNRSNEIGRW
jgi:hypothetical protein